MTISGLILTHSLHFQKKLLHLLILLFEVLVISVVDDGLGKKIQLKMGINLA
jgi:hypothetical protein